MATLVVTLRGVGFSVRQRATGLSQGAHPKREGALGVHSPTVIPRGEVGDFVCQRGHREKPRGPPFRNTLSLGFSDSGACEPHCSGEEQGTGTLRPREEGGQQVQLVQDGFDLLTCGDEVSSLARPIRLLVLW